MDLLDIYSQFLPNKRFVAYKKLSNGHINSTYLVISEDKMHYILQKINRVAFKDVDLLMNNISIVTNHLKQKNIESIEILKTVSGSLYVEQSNECYRMYRFIDNTLTFEKVEGIEMVRNSATAFGKFHNNLSDLDASLLGEVIPHFHDTPKRYNDLQLAIKNDVMGRLKNVDREIAVINRYVDIFPYIVDGIRSGEVKLHITHNDPKINNALFDEDTMKFRAIIDLDTVMPGSILYDFGDALRSLFTGDNEDSEDYENVVVNFEIYRNYLEAYYLETKDFLTLKEIELFPYAPFIMAIECGIRFLEDYLKGDVYFHTKYDDHNLVRARTQLNLAESIMKNIDEIKKITLEVIEKYDY